MTEVCAMGRGEQFSHLGDDGTDPRTHEDSAGCDFGNEISPHMAAALEIDKRLREQLALHRELDKAILAVDEIGHSVRLSSAMPADRVSDYLAIQRQSAAAAYLRSIGIEASDPAVQSGGAANTQPAAAVVVVAAADGPQAGTTENSKPVTEPSKRTAVTIIRPEQQPKPYWKRLSRAVVVADRQVSPTPRVHTAHVGASTTSLRRSWSATDRSPRSARSVKSEYSFAGDATASVYEDVESSVGSNEFSYGGSRQRDPSAVFDPYAYNDFSDGDDGFAGDGASGGDQQLAYLAAMNRKIDEMARVVIGGHHGGHLKRASDGLESVRTASSLSTRRGGSPLLGPAAGPGGSSMGNEVRRWENMVARLQTVLDKQQKKNRMQRQALQRRAIGIAKGIRGAGGKVPNDFAAIEESITSGLHTTPGGSSIGDGIAEDIAGYDSDGGHMNDGVETVISEEISFVREDSLGFTRGGGGYDGGVPEEDFLASSTRSTVLSDSRRGDSLARDLHRQFSASIESQIIDADEVAFDDAVDLRFAHTLGDAGVEESGTLRSTVNQLAIRSDVLSPRKGGANRKVSRGAVGTSQQSGGAIYESLDSQLRSVSEAPSGGGRQQHGEHRQVEYSPVGSEVSDSIAPYYSSTTPSSVRSRDSPSNLRSPHARRQTGQYVRGGAHRSAGGSSGGSAVLEEVSQHSSADRVSTELDSGYIEEVSTHGSSVSVPGGGVLIHDPAEDKLVSQPNSTASSISRESSTAPSEALNKQRASCLNAARSRRAARTQHADELRFLAITSQPFRDPQDALFDPCASSVTNDSSNGDELELEPGRNGALPVRRFLFEGPLTAKAAQLGKPSAFVRSTAAGYEAGDDFRYGNERPETAPDRVGCGGDAALPDDSTRPVTAADATLYPRNRYSFIGPNGLLPVSKRGATEDQRLADALQDEEVDVAATRRAASQSPDSSLSRSPLLPPAEGKSGSFRRSRPGLLQQSDDALTADFYKSGGFTASSTSSSAVVGYVAPLDPGELTLQSASPNTQRRAAVGVNRYGVAAAMTSAAHGGDTAIIRISESSPTRAVGRRAGMPPAVASTVGTDADSTPNRSGDGAQRKLVAGRQHARRISDADSVLMGSGSFHGDVAADVRASTAGSAQTGTGASATNTIATPKTSVDNQLHGVDGSNDVSPVPLPPSAVRHGMPAAADSAANRKKRPLLFSSDDDDDAFDDEEEEEEEEEGERNAHDQQQADGVTDPTSDPHLQRSGSVRSQGRRRSSSVLLPPLVDGHVVRETGEEGEVDTTELPAYLQLRHVGFTGYMGKELKVPIMDPVTTDGSRIGGATDTSGGAATQAQRFFTDPFSHLDAMLDRFQRGEGPYGRSAATLEPSPPKPGRGHSSQAAAGSGKGDGVEPSTGNDVTRSSSERDEEQATSSVVPESKKERRVVTDLFGEEEDDEEEYDEDESSFSESFASSAGYPSSAS